MEPKTFAAGMLQLSVTFSPKKDLPPEQHDLYDETWWRQVQQWDGACWLEAVSWWIGHKPWMPKVAELREAYDAFLSEKQREAAKVPALPAVSHPETEGIDANDPYSSTPEERRRWAEEDAWLRQYAKRLPQTLPDYAPDWDLDALTRNWQAVNRANLKPVERRAKERRIALEKEQAKAAIDAALLR